jgi:hypothetical protein
MVFYNDEMDDDKINRFDLKNNSNLEAKAVLQVTCVENLCGLTKCSSKD